MHMASSTRRLQPDLSCKGVFQHTYELTDISRNPGLCLRWRRDRSIYMHCPLAVAGVMPGAWGNVHCLASLQGKQGGVRLACSGGWMFCIR